MATVFDIEKESLITLASLARRLPSRRLGRPVDPVTCWRWARRGLVGPNGRRVYLETLMVGRTVYTWPQAVEEFFAAVTIPCKGPVPTGKSARTAQRRAARRKKVKTLLDAQGLN